MNTKQLRKYLQQDHSYDTKIVVIKKHCTTEQLQKWSIKVAESVLYIYEDKFSGDTRIRDCIQAAKDYLAARISKDELIKAIDDVHDAAYDAAHAAVAHASNAAHAVYDVAYYAANAAYAATYAANAATNKQEQEELNIQLMIETLEIRIPDTKIARKIYRDEIIREEDNYIVI